MSKIKNEVGKVFGYWTVVSRAENDQFNNARWNCRCVCGNMGIVLGAHLRKGSSSSCGCFNKLRTRETHSTDDSYFKRLFRNCKSGARVRNLDFCLTEEQYKELILKDCAYCGDAPYEPRFYARHDTGVFNCHGVDRVDNSVGYVLDNCVTACKLCNQIKMDATLEDFLTRVNKIYDKRIKNPQTD